MRGVTETTRGGTSTREQSHVAKRNASQEDLKAARATFLGKPVKLPNHPYAKFTCVDVRLDDLHRLIFDLVRESSRKPFVPAPQPQSEEAHANESED